MSRARSNFSQTVASSWLSLIVTAVCQLVTIPIALSVLSKADFALYAVIGQVLAAVMLAEFGIRSASSRLLIDAHTAGELHYQRMWMASAVIFAGQALVMMGILFIFTPFMGSLFHLEPNRVAEARGILLCVGAIKAISYALGIYGTSLYAGQELRRCNIVSVIASIIELIVFIVAIRSNSGLWAYPISMLISTTFVNFAFYRLAKQHHLLVRPSLKLLRSEELRLVFHLGFDVFLAGVFSMVMGNSLLIFSGHLLSVGVTAALAVNLKLVTLMVNILQRIPGSAGPLMMKMVSEEKLDQFRNWWRFLTKLTLGAALAAAGFFVIGNRHGVTLWAGADMVLPFSSAILLSLYAFRFLVHFQFVNSLAIFKEMRKVNLSLLWEVILYVGLAYSLASKFGLNGLLAANLLSAAGGSLPNGMRWMLHYSGISVHTQIALLLRASAPLILAFAALIWVGKTSWESSWLACAAAGTAWALVVAVIGYALVLDGRERGELNKLMGAVFQKFRSPARLSP